MSISRRNKPAIAGKCIASGLFTNCHEHTEDPGKVVLVTCDYVKECMGMGWFPESRLFPALHPLDWSGYDNAKQIDLRAYSVKRYDRPRSLKKSLCPRDWELYRLLRKMWDDYFVRRPEHFFNDWQRLFDSIPDEYEEEREDLKTALDACANYGSDICFEISPRNVAVDGDKLILLDCFFVHSQAKRIY